MKSAWLKVYCIVALLLLISVFCTRSAIKEVRTDNPSFCPELLFENEGVRVWRFADGGRYIYYTDARGRVEWTTTHHNGKNTYTVKRATETVE